MKIYHLSHTDLDGYGAQYITKHYFNDILFFNSNYGKEINEKFSKIESMLDGQPALILITDLNLTLNQCEDFQICANENNAKILLLDHHQSGLECAKNYPWYFLDSSRCATKITYDFFSSIYAKDAQLDKFVEVVNAVDMWHSDMDEFELGKVCLGLVAGAKEINKVMFDKESFEYICYLIKRSFEFYDFKDSHIQLDNAVHAIKKDFFRADDDNTLSNLISKFVVSQLNFNREKFLIYYRDKIGVLTHNIGNTSVIGNDFLVRNPDVDFFLDITSRKTMSFRANGNADVSLMAKELVGGGGHVNASGGIFNAFKDSYDYESVKAQIVNLIIKKTEARDI